MYEMHELITRNCKTVIQTCHGCSQPEYEKQFWSCRTEIVQVKCVDFTFKWKKINKNRLRAKEIIKKTGKWNNYTDF